MNQQAYMLGYLVKEADVPLSRIRAGPYYRGKPEALRKRLLAIEKRTGVPLDKMTILANKREIIRNLMRMYFPKTIRQIPSRGMRWLETAGAIATAPVAPMWLLQSVISKLNQAAGDYSFYYDPSVGIINLTESADPASMAHEVGHWVDYERGKAPIKRGWFRYKDPELKHMPKALVRELNATLFAQQALQPAEWKKHRQRLVDAYATYLLGNLERKRYKKKHKVGNWRKLVNKGETPEERKQNWRSVMSTIQHTTDPVMFGEEGDDIIFERGKRTTAVRHLADKIISHHQKRLEKQRQL